jgi:hypothetical protein
MYVFSPERKVDCTSSMLREKKPEVVILLTSVITFKFYCM